MKSFKEYSWKDSREKKWHDLAYTKINLPDQEKRDESKFVDDEKFVFDKKTATTYVREFFYCLFFQMRNIQKNNEHIVHFYQKIQEKNIVE